MSQIFVRINSHNAREKLENLLGRKPEYFYVWREKGYYAKVENSMLSSVIAIKGITKTKQNKEFWQCIGG